MASHTQQYTIELEGQTISYNLERKQVKNINMRLRKESGLTVSAPYHATIEQVEWSLRQHGKKIVQTLQAYAQQEHTKQQQYPITYTTGETVLYLGQYLSLEVARGTKEGVQVQRDKLLLLVRNVADLAQRKYTFDTWWNETCRRAILNLCHAVYPIFEEQGVRYPEIRFRHMVSQWGNCRSKRSVLTFNLRLLAAPVRCIEYVVFHEFTHFLHPNHSAQFYQFIATEIPDWQEMQKILQKTVETRLNMTLTEER